MNTKVKILPKVSNFSVGVVTYFPGDIIEIPESLYSAGFMEIISEPVKKEVVTVDPMVMALPKVDLPLKQEEEKPKPRRVTS